MNFKKLESGRSMVEMLGVLAIIGVLSVGGIAGYSLSMRRHRANQIIDGASKFALVAYNHCQQKILNREATSVTECGKFEFTDAGIGASPTGLRSHMYIPELGFSTDQTTGVDTVTVYLPVEDTKLCQAVASVSGATCDTNNINAILQIKQN